MPGLFIVLDGPDASGTSTQTKLLVERLQKEGHEVMQTAEPTDGPAGKHIREFLKPQASLPAAQPDPMELQLLFTKDRAWHVEHVIEPALKEGKIVVCDRYWHSTIIYADSQGLDVTELKKLNNNFIQPDVVFFTLPPIEVSLKRLEKRASSEIFEREDLQRKIHNGYEEMAAKNPQIHVIDTAGEKEETGNQIWNIVKNRL